MLRIHASRPSSLGHESHLVTIHKLVRDFAPSAVVVDPINNLVSVGSLDETRAMLVRLIDFMKGLAVTTIYNSLTSAEGSLERTDIGVSSLIDTWLLVKQIEVNGERNRTLFILKSRGMSHSNQVREFTLGERGI